jgi:hypothetical protein
MGFVSILHFDSTSMLVVWMSRECKVDQSSIYVRGFVWVLRLPAISRVVAHMSLVNESGIYVRGFVWILHLIYLTGLNEFCMVDESVWGLC